MCPYVGGSLVSLFDEKPQAATRLAARRMAEKGTDRMLDVTVTNTPIDKGNLRSSWYALPVQRVQHLLAPTHGAYQGTVASDVNYAPHVEYGTGLFGPSGAKYPIRPKKPGGMLRWTDRSTGDTVYAKAVMHPGSPGQHMLQIGGFVAEGEADDGTLFTGILGDWKRTVETSAD